MRLRALRFAAIVSLGLLSALVAEARPLYGGTLRVQLASSGSSLRDDALAQLTAETLTRLTPAGNAEPLLAQSWASDKGARRWRFHLRDGVRTHDGAGLTPEGAAGHLAPALKERGIVVTPTPNGLLMVANSPMADLPVQLADPAFSIPGTGPFQSSATNVLTAFEYHWAGRPFLDRIEFVPPRASLTPITAAEVWEVALGQGRRSIPDDLRFWSSEPIELLAIELTSPDPALASALSSAIDRESIATALTQRRAEPASALLPQWISGYSFLFSITRDLERARSLLASTRATSPVLSYDPADTLARVVAERVAVNARDIGLTLRVRPDPTGHFRVRRFKLSPNAAASLAQLGRAPASSDPEALYAAENSVLQTGRIVPILHLPLVFGFAPRVQLPNASRYVMPRLPLAEVWISQ